MVTMRAYVVLVVLALAAPAAAQEPWPLTQFQIDDLRMQQQMAQQRAIAQANELMALEARLRTEQAVAQAQAARAPVRLPELPYAEGAPPPVIDTSKLPSIPDAALAASNRRVQEAAKNRR